MVDECLILEVLREEYLQYFHREGKTPEGHDCNAIAYGLALSMAIVEDAVMEGAF